MQWKLRAAGAKRGNVTNQRSITGQREKTLTRGVKAEKQIQKKHGKEGRRNGKTLKDCTKTNDNR